MKVAFFTFKPDEKDKTGDFVMESIIQDWLGQSEDVDIKHIKQSYAGNGEITITIWFEEFQDDIQIDNDFGRSLMLSLAVSIRNK